jgi:hypothetical protein
MPVTDFTLNAGNAEMSETDGTKMILFRENALLPPDLATESEFFVPGWRIVKNLDGYALQRKLKESNWNFAHMAGEGKARVVGRAQHETLLKGVKMILAELRGRRFNSLEITVVTMKRFFGLTYLNIVASPRHFEGAWAGHA